MANLIAIIEPQPDGSNETYNVQPDGSFLNVDETQEFQIGIPGLYANGGDGLMYNTPGTRGRIDVPLLEMSDAGKKTITKALVEEIETVLHKEKLTAAEFMTVRRLAEMGREMVATGLPTPRRRNQAGVVAFDEEGGLIPEAYGSGSMNDETFGSKIIREVASALPALLRKRVTPAELVVAAHEARERGMKDIADKIEGQLMKELEPDAPSESKPDSPPVLSASNGAG